MLLEIGVPKKLAKSSIRITFGKYNTIEEMPDLVSTNKPSGNMSYTEAVDFKFSYDILNVYDWSSKGTTPFVECCQDGSASTYVLPGGMSMTNPYYKGSYYTP